LDELEKWLTPLGLAALAPTLRANDIDLDVLPALSETDLEKLGGGGSSQGGGGWHGGCCWSGRSVFLGFNFAPAPYYYTYYYPYYYAPLL